MKKTLFYSAAAVCGMALMFTACDKDDDNNDSEEFLGGKGHILLEPTVKNDDGASGASYLMQIEDFGSTVKLDNAIQIGFAATFSVYGNDVYMCPGEMVKSSQLLTRYERSNKGFKVAATYQILPGSSPYTVLKINDEKAYIPLYGQGNVQIVDSKTLKVKGEIDLSKYASATSAPTLPWVLSVVNTCTLRLTR